jgi:hypothetical protein
MSCPPPRGGCSLVSEGVVSIFRPIPVSSTTAGKDECHAGAQGPVTSRATHTMCFFLNLYITTVYIQFIKRI